MMTDASGRIENRRQIAHRSALERMVDVEVMANAVDFLTGDGSKNITGTVITVDAGNTA
jgi:3-oxoacyl-[acyl-carrier protein] reductase